MAISQFVYRRRVQFPETDASGIVHFTNFFKYVEEAEHAMWREAGLSIAGGGGIAWPRVDASFEFHRPLRFEDEFEVHLRIVTRDARTIGYEGVITKDGERVATGRMTIKCVSRKPGEPMRSIDMPAEIDSLFQVAR